MRIALSLLAALLTAGTVAAQEQERKLVDRIMKPDMTLESSVARKSFNGAGSFGGREYGTRSFDTSRTMGLRAYRTDPSDIGSKIPFFSKYIYRPAGTTPALKPARETGRTVDSRDVTVREAPEGERETPEYRSDRMANRAFLNRGKSQDIFDQQDSSQQRKLTIDDVRALLNKSK